MGSDMSPLFSEVVECMTIHDAELKKMCFLYLINYARTKPEAAVEALPILQQDLHDKDALIRAQALRTIAYIHVREYMEALAGALERLLADQDPYVRKTAAIAVSKLHGHDKHLARPSSAAMQRLHLLIHDDNSAVAAAALVACQDIADRSSASQISLDWRTSRKLAATLSKSGEWSQIYIMDALMHFVPQTQLEATTLAEHILPRLQHSNAAVVLAAVRLLMYLCNYMPMPEVEAVHTKLSPPLISMLGKGPELQFVALRNIDLVVSQAPHLLANKIGAFFCQFSEPLYLKLAKVEIIVRLAGPDNLDQVVSELKEYAGEVDVDLVRKAIKSLGRVALVVSEATSVCVAAVAELLSTRVTYVVQEGVVVAREILRKYPEQASTLLGQVCAVHDSIEEPASKAAFAWLLGQFADQLVDAAALLERLLETFADEPTEVQLALLTATVKLFVQRPRDGQALVPKVLKWVTEDVANPDVRDRGHMYWRLLSSDIAFTKRMLLDQKRGITLSIDHLEVERLKELCLEISTLASLYHRSPSSFLRHARRRVIQDSPALRKSPARAPQLRRRVTNPFLNHAPNNASSTTMIDASTAHSATAEVSHFDFMPLPRSTTFTTSQTNSQSTSAIADLLNLDS